MTLFEFSPIIALLCKDSVKSWINYDETLRTIMPAVAHLSWRTVPGNCAFHGMKVQFATGKGIL